MQHGFAACNGVHAAFLVRADYSGTERALERSYDGVFATFSLGLVSSPADEGASPFARLAMEWEIEGGDSHQA